MSPVARATVEGSVASTALPGARLAVDSSSFRGGPGTVRSHRYAAVPVEGRAGVVTSSRSKMSRVSTDLASSPAAPPS